MRGFDHRTIQHAHDLIAAWWRFRSGLRYPRIPGLGPTPEQLKHDWFMWLTDELKELCKEPRYVRCVVQAAAYGNMELGYKAEDELHEFLRERYAGMWRTRVDAEDA
jgi:hypothetical protein